MLELKFPVFCIARDSRARIFDCRRKASAIRRNLHSGASECGPSSISGEVRVLSPARFARQQRSASAWPEQLSEHVERPHNPRSVQSHSHDDARQQSRIRWGSRSGEHCCLSFAGEWRSCGLADAHFHDSHTDWRGARRETLLRGAQGTQASAAEARRASATVGAARGSNGCRRSEELRAGDRRNAAPSRSGRLADGPRKLSGVEPQPAVADQSKQCARSEAGMGVGDE